MSSYPICFAILFLLVFWDSVLCMFSHFVTVALFANV